MTKMERPDAPREVVIMGSKSDWATMQRTTGLLAKLERTVAERSGERAWT